MSIVISIHEPWHYRNWEPVLRHAEPNEISLVVTPWMHRGEDPGVQQQAVDQTLAWLKQHGVAAACNIEREPHVLATLAIAGRSVGYQYSRQVRMLYAVISKQYTYSEKNKEYDAVMVASTFGRNLLAKHQVRAQVVGYPKLDDYFNGVMTRASVREQLGLTADETIVLYAPTLASDSPVERYAHALSEIDPSIRVIAQLHPVSYISEPERFASLLPDRVEVVPELEGGIHWIAAADAVISDYSGATFEAAAMDKPVILLENPDLEMTEDVERAHRDVGIRVDDPADLAKAVDGALAEPERFADRREYYRETFFEYRGKAGERALEALRGFSQEARDARLRDTELIYDRMRKLEQTLGISSV